MPNLSAEAQTAPPRLFAVHPAGPAWPENILRFHLVCDRAMEPGDADGEVWLETAAGARVEGALVDIPDGLWSPDGTVLTLLFHPGRVKQGLAAHRALGRALAAGGDYRLVIGAGLTALDGCALAAARQIHLRIGAAETRGLDPAGWQWIPPRPGSTAPLVIATGRQIDALSLQGGVRLESDDGRAHPVALRTEGTTIIATPAAPWPDVINLAVAPWLEDVCGNRPHDGFERPPQIDQSGSCDCKGWRRSLPLRTHRRGPGQSRKPFGGSGWKRTLHQAGVNDRRWVGSCRSRLLNWVAASASDQATQFLKLMLGYPAPIRPNLLDQGAILRLLARRPQENNCKNF